MQYCDCTIALRGDQNLQVIKKGLSVPEILLFMAGHGRAAVKEIPGTRSERNVEHPKEYARLVRIHGTGPVKTLFGGSSFAAKFPTRLADIDFADEAGDPAPEAPAEKEEGPTLVELPVPEPEPEPENLTLDLGGSKRRGK